MGYMDWNDAGKDWRLKEKRETADEMVGWHLWFNRRELGRTPGDGEGQGGLACCSPWDGKQPDTTEWLNNNTGRAGQALPSSARFAASRKAIVTHSPSQGFGLCLTHSDTGWWTCRVRELEKVRFGKRTRPALYRNRPPLMKQEGAAVRLVSCCTNPRKE